MGSGLSAASRGVNLPGISTRLSPNSVACVMSARKARALVLTDRSDATAGMIVVDVKPQFSAIASRASTSMSYTIIINIVASITVMYKHGTGNLPVLIY